MPFLPVVHEMMSPTPVLFCIIGYEVASDKSHLCMYGKLDMSMYLDIFLTPLYNDELKSADRRYAMPFTLCLFLERGITNV